MWFRACLASSHEMGDRPERHARPPPASASMMNLGDAVSHPTEAHSPLNTYVAVARGDQGHRSQTPNLLRISLMAETNPGEIPKRADTPAPGSYGQTVFSEFAGARSRESRLDATAVHLRLALPQVRAALRELRDACETHASGNASGDLTDAAMHGESAGFASSLKHLASQLMEMDALALRACCKQVVHAVRRLLAVTGKRSSERTQLATLLFSLSRYLPLVASLGDGDAGLGNSPGAGAGAGAMPSGDDPVGTTASAKAHDVAMREHAKTLALVDAATNAFGEKGVARNTADNGSANGTTPASSARAASRVILSLTEYAHSVSEWQTALAEDELTADAMNSMGATGREESVGSGETRQEDSREAQRISSPSLAMRPVPRRPEQTGALLRTMSVGVNMSAYAPYDQDADDGSRFGKDERHEIPSRPSTDGCGPVSGDSGATENSNSVETVSAMDLADTLKRTQIGNDVTQNETAGGVGRPLSYARALGVGRETRETNRDSQPVGGPRPPAPQLAGATTLSARKHGPYFAVASGSARERPTPVPLPKPSPRAAGAPPPLPHRRRLSDDFPNVFGTSSGYGAASDPSKSSSPLRYRDALLPPRNVSSGGDTMLAQVLAKNAERAAASVASPNSTPPTLLRGFPVSRNLPTGTSGFHHAPGGFAHRSAHGAYPYGGGSLGSRPGSVTGTRAGGGIPAGSGNVGTVLQNATFHARVPEGHIVCRMCERPVFEDQVPEHSRCCAAMRDADLRALALGASIGERTQRARDAIGEVGRKEFSSAAPGNDSFASFTRVHEYTCEIATKLAVDPSGVDLATAARGFDALAKDAKRNGNVAAETAAIHVRDLLLDVTGSNTSPRYPSSRRVSMTRMSTGTVVTNDSDEFGQGSPPRRAAGRTEPPRFDDSPPRRRDDAKHRNPWGADSVPGSPTSYGGVSSFAPSQSHAVAPSIEDFEILKRVSSGAYGKVYLCRKHATGDVYAVKVIRKKDLVFKNMVDQAMTERAALINTNNPFIVKLFYTFSSARHLYIVTEYAVGGDLYSLLQKLGRLSEAHAKQYAAEIVLALEYCHARGIIHRDLKPDNLLIAKNGHVKLTDFGLSNIGIARDNTARSAVPAPRGDSEQTTQAQHALKTSRFAGSSGNQASSSAQAPSAAPSTYAGSGYGSDTTDNINPGNEHGGFSSRASSLYDYSHHAMQPRVGVAMASEKPFAGAKDGADASRGTSSAQQVPNIAKGTPDYLAPEVLLCEPYGPEVDWWALGVVVFELLTGAPPFHASEPVKIFENILSNDVAWPPDTDRYVGKQSGDDNADNADDNADSDDDDDDPGLSPHAKDFIASLLRPDVETRLGTARGAAEVKEHAFFANVDFVEIFRSQSKETHEIRESSARPVFVPKPDDQYDTSYFVEKPRVEDWSKEKSTENTARVRGSRQKRKDADAGTNWSSQGGQIDVNHSSSNVTAYPLEDSASAFTSGSTSPVAAVASESELLGAAPPVSAAPQRPFRLPMRRPRRSSLGNSSLGYRENYASSAAASSRAASEAASSDDETDAAASSLRRTVRSMLGPEHGGGWRVPGHGNSPTRGGSGSPNPWRTPRAGDGSHSYPIPLAAARPSGLLASGAPSFLTRSGGRNASGASAVSAGHSSSTLDNGGPGSSGVGSLTGATSDSNTGPRSLTASPPLHNRAGSEFDSGRSEGDLYMGQLSASDGEVEESNARDERTRGMSPHGSATDGSSSDEMDPDTQREAALLTDFGYTNLSELARENVALAARSRQNTPRVSLVVNPDDLLVRE